MGLVASVQLILGVSILSLSFPCRFIQWSGWGNFLFLVCRRVALLCWLGVYGRVKGGAGWVGADDFLSS